MNKEKEKEIFQKCKLTSELIMDVLEKIHLEERNKIDILASLFLLYVSNQGFEKNDAKKFISNTLDRITDDEWCIKKLILKEEGLT